MYGQSKKQREDGRIAAPWKLSISLVPEAGLEPAQGCPYRILSPARLPFHHSGTKIYEEITIIFLAIFFKRLWFSLALPSVPTSTRLERRH